MYRKSLIIDFSKQSFLQTFSSLHTHLDSKNSILGPRTACRWQTH